jgi:hypothetical protein
LRVRPWVRVAAAAASARVRWSERVEERAEAERGMPDSMKVRAMSRVAE